MTRPIAQNADPAFTAGGKGGGKGTFRLLNGEWRVWGNETGTQLVSRVGWPALRTNCVAQAQLARRPLHPLLLTERSAPSMLTRSRASSFALSDAFTRSVQSTGRSTGQGERMALSPFPFRLQIGSGPAALNRSRPGGQNCLCRLPAGQPALAERQACRQENEIAHRAAGGGDGHHRPEIDERLELAGTQGREADRHGQAGKDHARARDLVAVEQALRETPMLALTVKLHQAVEGVVHREPERHTGH